MYLIQRSKTTSREITTSGGQAQAGATELTSKTDGSAPTAWPKITSKIEGNIYTTANDMINNGTAKRKGRRTGSNSASIMTCAFPTSDRMDKKIVEMNYHTPRGLSIRGHRPVACLPKYSHVALPELFIYRVSYSNPILKSGSVIAS